MSELATVQRWLTSIMVRPGRLRDKIFAADANYGLESKQLIVSSETLNAEDRIGIYARGYVLRLMECMRADYPLLENLMGAELFEVFAQAYLVQLPSHSPSLFDLGKDFPDFLEASQPKEVNGEGASMFALPLELARLERTRVEVSRSEGLEKRDRQMPDTDPLFYLFGGGQFCISPCLRLIALEFDLLDFIRQTERGEDAQVPIRKATFAAVSRKHYSVNLQALEPWQWHFLQALGDSGSQREAVNRSSAMLGISADALSAELMLWLPAALQRGYVYWSEEAGR